jgi:hypothetical protein
MKRVVPGLLLAVVLLYSLLNSWGADPLSSHSYRQTQTAQTVEIFLSEGWNPLLPKVRYIGKPGVLALEFPVYQSMVTGLVSVLHMPLVQTARLLNWLFALVYAGLIVGVVKILTGRFREPEELILAFTLVLSLPLLLGVSQWVSVECLNCALAAASLFSVLRYFGGKGKGLGWLGGFFLCSQLSLLIKPNVLIAFTPLFLLALGRAFPLQKGRVAWVCVGGGVAAVIAGSWFLYGNRVSSANSPSIESTTGFLFSVRPFLNGASFAKLGGRVLLYVLGPGTLAFAAFAAIRRQWALGGEKGFPLETRPWLWAAACGGLLYIGIFLSLNMRHNYYQLPLVLLFALPLLILVRGAAEGPAGRVFLVLAVGCNMVWSHQRLTLQDPDWQQLVRAVQPALEARSGRDEIELVYNEGSAQPILAFYLRRYLINSSYKDWAGASAGRDWIAICDGAERDGADCEAAVEQKEAGCRARARRFGRLWACW